MSEVGRGDRQEHHWREPAVRALQSDGVSEVVARHVHVQQDDAEEGHAGALQGDERLLHHILVGTEGIQAEKPEDAAGASSKRHHHHQRVEHKHEHRQHLKDQENSGS